MRHKRLFVIGSLSQENEIFNIYEKIDKEKHDARYVKKQPEKSFQELVDEAYANIEWADIVIVLCKPDGLIGKGTICEIEYAMYMRKVIHLCRDADVDLKIKEVYYV